MNQMTQSSITSTTAMLKNPGMYCNIILAVCNSLQRAKKVLSDSPGLVDFAIGLVNSVFNLPNGRVRFFEEFE